MPDAAPPSPPVSFLPTTGLPAGPASMYLPCHMNLGPASCTLTLCRVTLPKSPMCCLVALLFVVLGKPQGPGQCPAHVNITRCCSVSEEETQMPANKLTHPARQVLMYDYQAGAECCVIFVLDCSEGWFLLSMWKYVL